MIFHTAVLYYVRARAAAAAFREKVKARRHLARVRGRRRARLRGEPTTAMAPAQDGERVAWADGHGRELSWG